MSVAAVVLAAGASSRLGQPKQLLLDMHGEPLVHKVARDAFEAGCRPVCVVVGAHAIGVRAAVSDLDVLVVQNLVWPEGLSTSIRCGVTAVVESNPLPAGRNEVVGKIHTDAEGQTSLNVNTQLTSFGSVDGVLLLTCDMPSVGPAHIHKLISEFNNASSHVASSYGDTWGIPAIFPAADFAELQALEGDKGGKSILMSRGASLVTLEGGTFDLDTLEDVARWRLSSRR